MQEIKYEIINNDELINYLKGFTGLSNNLLLEVKNDDFIQARCSDDTRAMVRHHKINFNSIFKYISGDIPDKNIFIGIYSIEKFIKILSLTDNNSTLTLRYIENSKKKTKNSENNIDGIELNQVNLQKNRLKFDINCAESKLFNYIDDDKFENQIANSENCDFNFVMTKDLLDRIITYSNISDSDFRVTFNNNIINFNGDNWSYGEEIKEMEKSNEVNDEYEIFCYKSLFDKLERFDFNVCGFKQKIVFRNDEKDMITVIANGKGINV